ncbi:MAG: hypothetical protein R2692_07355 [Microbacterium sp.]
METFSGSSARRRLSTARSGLPSRLGLALIALLVEGEKAVRRRRLAKAGGR